MGVVTELKAGWKDVKFVYICHPITTGDKREPKENIALIEKIAVALYMEHDVFPVSPWHTCLPITGGTFKSPQFKWYDLALALMVKCDVVYAFPGWEDSFGCRQEVNLALALGIAVEGHSYPWDV
jgi:hypothetical protein